MKYYEKILASKPLAADYLNAGHVAWRTGTIEKAAELYSKAALEYGGQEIFREMVGKDKEKMCIRDRDYTASDPRALSGTCIP